VFAEVSISTREVTMVRKPRFCSQCGKLVVRRYVEGRLRELCPACETVHYRNPLPVAATVVLNDNRELLLVKRKRVPHKGAWCLPMGFAECGETASAAALRELREEAGIAGCIVRLLDVDSFLSDHYGDMLIVTFEVKKIGGVEQPGDDAAAAAYFPIARLPALAFPSNEKAIQMCRSIHREEWMLQDARLDSKDEAPLGSPTDGIDRSFVTPDCPPSHPTRTRRPAVRCPFLRDTKVRFCRVAPVRKMLPSSLIHTDDQRCSSEAYRHCPVAQEHLDGRTSLPCCPFLKESPVQYCAAAPVTKFIPHVDDVAARCSGAGHRYCQIYLQRAHLERFPKAGLAEETIPVLRGRAYSENHMWIDVAEDGTCQVGADRFLARALGEVEQVAFVPGKQRRKPTVILTVQGVDLSLTFPHSMTVTDSNVLLRNHPDMLCGDPYWSGWLFAGDDLETSDSGGSDRRNPVLRRGKAAEEWMRDEVGSMSLLAYELTAGRTRHGKRLMGDGGIFRARLARHLNRTELLYLFNSFFGSR
jgi:ADP-ribose pyrophosphatase YjhB (NUDIX family)/glycine cleavage system H lipoate-binding protein